MTLLSVTDLTVTFDGFTAVDSASFTIEPGETLGVVGCVVGASFAVLVAEELFVSGCKLLISITSSGQLTSVQKPPYFILIDK